jgi:hypothetical protein
VREEKEEGKGKGNVVVESNLFVQHRQKSSASTTGAELPRSLLVIAIGDALLSLAHPLATVAGRFTRNSVLILLLLLLDLVGKYPAIKSIMQYTLQSQ